MTEQPKPIHFREIDYGFEYGAASVERWFSDWKKGSVTIGFKTRKGEMQIGVSKTGKVTIFASPKTKTSIRFVEVKK
jgi:hypothetical protein